MGVSVNTYSQDDVSLGSIQPLTKFIAKANFRVPFAVSNPFFKENSQGVVQVSGSLNYSFAKNFYIGAGYDYTFFKLSEIKLNVSPNQQLGAKVEKQGLFGELSYFYELYENVLFEANIQIGQETVRSTSAKCAINGESHTQKGLYWNPNLNVYLLTDEPFSFYFSLGYRSSTVGFTPGDICETTISGFSEDVYKGNYGEIQVGFGVGFAFIKPSN